MALALTGSVPWGRDEWSGEDRTRVGDVTGGQAEGPRHRPSRQGGPRGQQDLSQALSEGLGVAPGGAGAGLPSSRLSCALTCF